MQSYDGSTSFQEAFTITISDDVAPSAPTSLDLNAASDSGSSNTDNYTNDTTPTLSGSAEAGSTVKLFSSVTGKHCYWYRDCNGWNVGDHNKYTNF